MAHVPCVTSCPVWHGPPALLLRPQQLVGTAERAQVSFVIFCLCITLAFSSNKRAAVRKPGQKDLRGLGLPWC